MVTQAQALRSTRSYESALQRTYRRWLFSLPAEDVAPSSLPILARDLTHDLEEDAEDAFLLAFLLGYGGFVSDPASSRVVPIALTQNAAFLTSSLHPYIVQKLSQSLDPATLSPISSRISLYTQPYWSLIWEGLGAFARQLTHEGRNYTITWNLDDIAAHCTTCPPKSRTYQSYQDLILFCGGVPGSLQASDECGPGCRCYLTLTPLDPIDQLAYYTPPSPQFPWPALI